MLFVEIIDFIIFLQIQVIGHPRYQGVVMMSWRLSSSVVLRPLISSQELLGQS